MLRECEGKYGCRNDHTKQTMEGASSAQRARGGAGIYPALWFGFAHEDFLSELKRWIQETSEQEKDANTKPIPKEPSDEARKAYQLYGVLGNQKEVAEAMNKELHCEDFYQGKVSRLIKQYKRWLAAAGLPDVNKMSKREVATVDPEKLYLGKRTDGRATGDPLNKRQ
jgi:hypothetical protein